MNAPSTPPCLPQLPVFHPCCPVPSNPRVFSTSRANLQGRGSHNATRSCPPCKPVFPSHLLYRRTFRIRTFEEGSSISRGCLWFSFPFLLLGSLNGFRF